MQFIDLAAQQARIRPVLERRIADVLRHGRYIMGPEVRELEERLAAFCGARHCLGCASGSAALDLVLLAWGVGPGDAVLTTSLSFIATAESIARTGATPVFVDIDHHFNLNAARLEQALTALEKGDPRLHPLPRQAVEGRLRARAIIAVDLFGRPADYDEILAVARRRGLKVLEDAAQGFGGRYRDRALCACGCDAAATSFFPAKPLGCYGDGGAVFTDDAKLAALVDSLRYHGRRDAEHKNDNLRLGMNGRLDTLQAAILLAKMDIFAQELEARREVAAGWARALAHVPGLTLPAPVQAPSRSTWAQYTVLLPAGADRAALAARLAAQGIPTAVNYPRGLHTQQAFAGLGYAPEDFPVTLELTARVLSLPMHPYLDAAAQQRVAESLRAALARQPQGE